MRRKLLLHAVLPILILLLVVNLFFVPQAQASISYSNGTNSFTLSFDVVEDLGPCSSASYWLVNLGYNNGTETQGSAHDINTHSATDSFSIANGTAIQLIELWAGASASSAASEECSIQIAIDSNGIFTWQGNTAPVISSILVSNVTSSSVTVSWTTDVESSSIVDYGTTSSYGSNRSSSTSTTSHSISLTGLSASTTYHYRVRSEANGISGESSDNTFATPATGSTGTTTTGTSTSTVTATPTVTPRPDRTAPAVSIDTDVSKPFLKPPKMSGKASDASGIAKVEYSIDDGKNWSAVDEIPNLGQRFITFTFTPPTLEDDNYLIRVRATDNATAKNSTVSDAVTVIIDRLPPRIGGNIIAIGPQVLFPGSGNYLLTAKGVKQKITLSAVGGPVQIELVASPQEGNSGQAKTYKLSRSATSGLWSGTIQFDEAGIYQLTGKSIDGAGNATGRALNQVAVLESGKILGAGEKPINNALIKLYYFEEKHQQWRLWDGPSYNQKNPTKTNEQGEFSYLVPAGKYYFAISAVGYTNTVSAIFETDGPTILNPSFSLKPLKLLFGFWIFNFYLPDFSTATLPIRLAVPVLPDTENELLDTEAPTVALPTTDNATFNLSSTRGTATVLTFLNLWSPQVREQLTALDKLNNKNLKGYAVMTGNSISKTSLFKKNGGYKTTILVDTDSTLVDTYKLNTLPAHYFLDRRGVIKKVVNGVLNEKEMEDILLTL